MQSRARLVLLELSQGPARACIIVPVGFSNAVGIGVSQAGTAIAALASFGIEGLDKSGLMRIGPVRMSTHVSGPQHDLPAESPIGADESQQLSGRPDVAVALDPRTQRAQPPEQESVESLKQQFISGETRWAAERQPA
ncbi:MAG: hypothetical protein GC200_11535 [Tepidisphaera sp.]|nr:hypothetical protein [Tepidisphaera sp.]